jgi:hypothetical protein
MRLFGTWRRRALGLVAVAVLGLAGVGVTAGSAEAGVVCRVPGPPHSAWAEAGGLGWMGVHWEPPVDTILGTACTPVTSYYVAVQDVTWGETGLWDYFQMVSAQWLEAWDILTPGHYYEFEVFAGNRVGWSAPTITHSYRDY